MLTPENGRKTEKPETSHRFELGDVYLTPGAVEALEEADVLGLRYLTRHAMGDWGDVSDDDKRANDRALVDGSRIFSAYILPVTGEKIWIITEADRSKTTFLLPDEY